jgi:hypothetical protein
MNRQQGHMLPKQMAEFHDAFLTNRISGVLAIAKHFVIELFRIARLQRVSLDLNS